MLSDSLKVGHGLVELGGGAGGDFVAHLLNVADGDERPLKFVLLSLLSELGNFTAFNWILNGAKRDYGVRSRLEIVIIALGV